MPVTKFDMVNETVKRLMTVIRKQEEQIKHLAQVIDHNARAGVVTRRMAAKALRKSKRRFKVERGV